MNFLDFLRRMFPMAQPPAEPEPAKSKPAGTPSSPTATPPVRFYPQSNRKTQNVSAGRVIKPTHIVLHHSSGAYAGSVSWCLDPVSKVSYHCIVARNGKRTVLATPSQRTWHAGVSSWQGRKDANTYSIGMAWEGYTYQTPLSEDAILSAVEYLLPILDEYHIPLANIIRHADVSPGRKDDCSPAAHAALLAALNRGL